MPSGGAINLRRISDFYPDRAGELSGTAFAQKGAMRSALTRVWVSILVLLFSVSAAQAASLTLAWDPSPEPVGGYILYWGTETGVYPNSVDVGNVTTYQVTGLAAGTDLSLRRPGVPQWPRERPLQRSIRPDCCGRQHHDPADAERLRR